MTQRQPARHRRGQVGAAEKEFQPDKRSTGMPSVFGLPGAVTFAGMLQTSILVEDGRGERQTLGLVGMDKQGPELPTCRAFDYAR